ncbi:MAG: contact-dependent growth inhibition system immunity protein [Alphaproteobacteria bacterium]
MRTEKDWIKSAYVQMNGKFINIGSFSGHGMISVDFNIPDFFFDLKVQENELGEFLLKAIENSRFLSVEDYASLRENGEENYKDWIKNTMKYYGYKKKGDMFKPMFSCEIRKMSDGFLFDPSHQSTMNYWEGNEYTKANKFKIPLTATAPEMGAALRRCLALCTSKFDPPKDA